MYKMKNARTAALAALEKCRRAGAWSDAVLGSVMDDAGLEGRDRGLTSALCYGVIQNQYYLDHCIGAYSSVKTAKLEPKVLDILRLSACQLLFMDKIPVSAAVNEGVALTKQFGYARAAGLVNAVLRRISENREHLPEIKADSREEYLSVRYSCPVKLTEYYCSRLGPDEAEKLLKIQNSTPPVTAQVNTLRTTADELLAAFGKGGLKAEPHPRLPDCILLEDAGSVAAMSEFQNGLFYVQDAAAKLAAIAAEPFEGAKILDVCAAPGGKSIACAILSRDGAEITACDLHANKLKRIHESAGRLGLRSIKTECADGRVFNSAWERSFDIVIADVPCSGLGVIRKKPDIRYKDMSEFEALPQIQRDILENVSRYVRPGGTLVYSTCTVRSEENEQVADDFLSRHGDFAFADFTLPGEWKSENGKLQLWPQRNDTDGFFIAKFRRSE